MVIHIPQLRVGGFVPEPLVLEPLVHNQLESLGNDSCAFLADVVVQLEDAPPRIGTACAEDRFNRNVVLHHQRWVH